MSWRRCLVLMGSIFPCVSTVAGYRAADTRACCWLHRVGATSYPVVDAAVAPLDRGSTWIRGTGSCVPVPVHLHPGTLPPPVAP